MNRRKILQHAFNIINLFVIVWLIVHINFNNSKQNKQQLDDISVNSFKKTFSNSEQDARITNMTKKVSRDDRKILDSSTLKSGYKDEMNKLNEEKVDADNPRLLQMIREHFIVPPSNLPYNLAEINKRDTSMGQAAFVDNRLGYKKEGFFVESGAHDGEYLSNTLFFERYRDWTGVLIEPLPKSFQKLRLKRRKAYIINACLSVHPYPSKEYMTTTPVIGGIVKNNTKQKFEQEQIVEVQCFPLYSILLALNRTNVDFLSLDVEGVELGVLNTVPWRKVNITMMSIEFDKWPGGSGNLCMYMKRRGYNCGMTMVAAGAADVLFQKRY